MHEAKRVPPRAQHREDPAEAERRSQVEAELAASVSELEAGYNTPITPDSVEQCIDVSTDDGAFGPFAKVVEAFPRSDAVREAVWQISARLDDYLVTETEAGERTPSVFARALLEGSQMVAEGKELSPDQRAVLQAVQEHLAAEMSVAMADLATTIEQAQQSGEGYPSLMGPIESADKLMASAMTGRDGHQAVKTIFGMMQDLHATYPELPPVVADAEAQAAVIMPEHFTANIKQVWSERLKEREKYASDTSIREIVEVRTKGAQYVLDQEAAEVEHMIDELKLNLDQRSRILDPDSEEYKAAAAEISEQIHNLEAYVESLESVEDWMEGRLEAMAEHALPDGSVPGVVMQRELHFLHGARRNDAEQQQADVHALNGLNIIKDINPGLYVRLMGMAEDRKTNTVKPSDLHGSVLTIAMDRSQQLLAEAKGGEEYDALQQYFDGLTTMDQRQLPLLAPEQIRAMEQDIGKEFGSAMAESGDALVSSMLGIAAVYQLHSLSERKRAAKVLEAINDMEMRRWDATLQKLRTGHPDDVVHIVYTTDEQDRQHPEFRRAVEQRLDWDHQKGDVIAYVVDRYKSKLRGTAVSKIAPDYIGMRMKMWEQADHAHITTSSSFWDNIAALDRLGAKGIEGVSDFDAVSFDFLQQVDADLLQSSFERYKRIAADWTLADDAWTRSVRQSRENGTFWSVKGENLVHATEVSINFVSQTLTNLANRGLQLVPGVDGRVLLPDSMSEHTDVSDYIEKLRTRIEETRV